METRNVYGAPATPIAIRPQCLLRATKWEQPFPAEIRAALKMANISGEKFGLLIDVQGRTVRRWMEEENPASIPYAAWAILCRLAGLGDILENEPLTPEIPDVCSSH